MGAQTSPNRFLSRRQLAVGGLAASVALMARAAEQPAGPPQTGPTPTDSTGLVAGAVSFPGFDQTIGGYRAYPRGRKNLPTVVFLPMIKGINFPIHQDFVRRLAREGYYVILPDLWARKGDANTAPSEVLVRGLVGAPDEAQQQLDIDAAIAFAAKEGANTKRLGVLGYDNGARVAYKYTARNPKVLAGVAYSGPLEATPIPRYGITESHPTPIELAAGMKGRMLGVYGDKEGSISPEEIEAMRKALAAAGDTKTQIVVLPGRHGFITDFDTTPSSTEAWKRGVAWLKAHGVG